MASTTSQNFIRLPSLSGPDDLLTLHQAYPQRYPFLLESRAGNATARFDILFACPQQRLTLRGDGSLEKPFATDAKHFLAALDRWFIQQRNDTEGESDLPFTGGWFLYLGYELAAEIEPCLELPMPAPDARVAEAVRIPLALIHDHTDQSTWLVGEAGFPEPRRQILQDCERLSRRAETLPVTRPIRRLEEEPALRYLERIRKAQTYIYNGDVFQANLSRPWQASLEGDLDPAGLYRSLRTANPGPYNGLAVWDDQAVISSSPELLFRRRGQHIHTRPIAGTRPRGADPAADRQLAGELLGHVKERAEHIMLIDLERNDLGRVCRPGSVVVDELMALESYAHVHHIESEVQGVLRDGVLPGALIRALFPGGTITGCPKVRCMEIIAELEGAPRGAYTGSMGYLNLNGDMTLNILIRTLEAHADQVTFRAGAGIVSDSVAEHELAETRAKAEGMVRALRPGTS